MGDKTQHEPAATAGSERARGAAVHVLIAAWAVLVAALGGIVVWTHLGDAPPPAREAVRVPLPPAPKIVVAPATAEGESRSDASPASPPPVAGADAQAVPPPSPEPRAEAATTTDAPTPDAPETGTTRRSAPAQAAPAEQAAAGPTPATAPAAQSTAPAPSAATLAPSVPQQQAAVVPPQPAPPPANAPAWIRFGRSFDANDRRPRIAIVVTELGLSSAATTAAIQRLPGEVTLAFSPYADGLSEWIGLARAAGHEVLLNLPMEPINFPADDPGPRTLLTSLSTQQNLERLGWVLGRVSGYVGVTNQMGSRFTAMPDALKPVLSALNDRGLMFLDSRTTQRSVAAKLAADIGLPRAIVNRHIDREASRSAIDGRLVEIERIARETGSAVAMAQPYPVTLERLAAWIATLETSGFVLAPLTAVANRQTEE